MARIDGTGGSDLLSGTTVADSLFGYAGADTLFGNAGNDSLYGGAGNDLLDGGGGNDLLDGGDGIDIARYDIAAALVASLYAGQVSFPGTGWLQETLVSIENFVAGSGNDTVSGSTGANALWGGGGNDSILGGAGADTLDGGAGADTLVGGTTTSRDTVDRRPLAAPTDTVRYDWATTSVVADLDARTATLAGETDTLYVIDNLWGGSAGDTLRGNTYANELRGGAGGDSLVGHAGDDTLWGQGGRDTLDGGDGTDTVVYSDNTTPVRVDLAAGSVTFAGQPWLPETLVSIENAVGGSGADTLLGTAGANVFRGGAGADRIDGRGGSDTVSFAGETAGVLVDLAAGRSGTIGSSVRDTLVSIESATGGAGNDSLVGNAAANVLDGGAGIDTLRGAGGDDILHFSSGNDRLDGGAGNDTVVLVQPWADYANGYREIYWDEYGYSWTFDGPTDATAHIDLVAGEATSLYGDPRSATLVGIENVTTGVGNDHVYGSAAANVISVDHGANYVEGRGGNDTITGSNPTLEADAWDFYYTDYRDAEEIVRGGGGNDRIIGATHAFGDAGNDTLVAGWYGGQEMTGGAGADRFQFSDAYTYEVYHGPVAIAQGGRLLDFDPDEGDRIVIDRTDDSAPAPAFKGAVTDVLDLDENSYGILGNTVVYAAYKSDGDWTYDFVIGPRIQLVGFTGTLAADDVLFI